MSDKVVEERVLPAGPHSGPNSRLQRSHLAFGSRLDQHMPKEEREQLKAGCQPEGQSSKFLSMPVAVTRQGHERYRLITILANVSIRDLSPSAYGIIATTEDGRFYFARAEGLGNMASYLDESEHKRWADASRLVEQEGRYLSYEDLAEFVQQLKAAAGHAVAIAYPRMYFRHDTGVDSRTKSAVRGLYRELRRLHNDYAQKPVVTALHKLGIREHLPLYTWVAETPDTSQQSARLQAIQAEPFFTGLAVMIQTNRVAAPPEAQHFATEFLKAVQERQPLRELISEHLSLDREGIRYLNRLGSVEWEWDAFTGLREWVVRRMPSAFRPTNCRTVKALLPLLVSADTAKECLTGAGLARRLSTEQMQCEADIFLHAWRNMARRSARRGWRKTISEYRLLGPGNVRHPSNPDRLKEGYQQIQRMFEDIEENLFLGTHRALCCISPWKWRWLAYSAYHRNHQPLSAQAAAAFVFQRELQVIYKTAGLSSGEDLPCILTPTELRKYQDSLAAGWKLLPIRSLDGYLSAGQLLRNCLRTGTGLAEVIRQYLSVWILEDKDRRRSCFATRLHFASDGSFSCRGTDHFGPGNRPAEKTHVQVRNELVSFLSATLAKEPGRARRWLESQRRVIAMLTAYERDGSFARTCAAGNVALLLRDFQVHLPLIPYPFERPAADSVERSWIGSSTASEAPLPLQLTLFQA